MTSVNHIFFLDYPLKQFNSLKRGIDFFFSLTSGSDLKKNNLLDLLNFFFYSFVRNLILFQNLHIWIMILQSSLANSSMADAF